MNQKEGIEFERVPRVVVGDQQFVQLFARPDADGLLLAVRANCRGEISDPHRSDLGNKNLAAMHHAERPLHEFRAVVEADSDLVMRGSVIGNLPVLRRSLKNGTTLPREPMTLP